MKEEYICIGFITNKNYLQHLGVSMFSIMKNCSCASNIRFYIFEEGLDNKDKKMLRDLCEEFQAKVEFIQEEKELFKDLKVGSHLPKLIYCKLYFPNKMTKLKRIIVLDSDVIVEGDIKELWKINLGGKTLGAVPDGFLEIQSLSKKNLNIPEKNEYFNSGVMIIDCNRWRKKDIINKIIKFIKENPEKITIQEQDGLNFVLQNDWVILPYKWNVIHSFYYNSSKLKDKLGKQKVKEIADNPKIIHYTSKPWFYRKYHPKSDRYWYYLRQTPWKNYEYPDKNLKNFILRTIRKIALLISWETKVKVKEIFHLDNLVK